MKALRLIDRLGPRRFADATEGCEGRRGSVGPMCIDWLLKDLCISP